MIASLSAVSWNPDFAFVGLYIVTAEQRERATVGGSGKRRRVTIPVTVWPWTGWSLNSPTTPSRAFNWPIAVCVGLARPASCRRQSATLCPLRRWIFSRSLSWMRG